MLKTRRFSIIKRQYTAKIQVNADGFVAQKTEDIVGTKEVTRTAHFDDQKTFTNNLRYWSIGRWDFYESEEDKQVNETANDKEITDFIEVDTYAESNDVYHHSYQTYQWIKFPAK